MQFVGGFWGIRVASYARGGRCTTNEGKGELFPSFVVFRVFLIRRVEQTHRYSHASGMNFLDEGGNVTSGDEVADNTAV